MPKITVKRFKQERAHRQTDGHTDATKRIIAHATQSIINKRHIVTGGRRVDGKWTLAGELGIQVCCLPVQVDDIGALERDEIVCVSSHRRFVRPQESQRFIELKANWTRACRQRGHRPSNDANHILFTATREPLNDKVTTSSTQPCVPLESVNRVPAL